jgi:hypothetical protein
MMRLPVTNAALSAILAAIARRTGLTPIGLVMTDDRTLHVCEAHVRELGLSNATPAPDLQNDCPICGMDALSPVEV